MGEVVNFPGVVAQDERELRTFLLVFEHTYEGEEAVSKLTVPVMATSLEEAEDVIRSLKDTGKIIGEVIQGSPPA